MRIIAAVLTSSLAIAVSLAPSPSAHRAATAAASDTTCTACRDFFTWANRAWLDTATIPPDQEDVGAWSGNAARVQSQLHDILEAARRRGASPLGAFYTACMDSMAANRTGTAPIASILAAIDTLATPADVARELGRLHRSGIPALFDFSSELDRVGTLRYVALVGQVRPTLPAAAYAASDSASVSLRQAYRDHVTRLLELSGSPPARAADDAARVLSLEGVLARSTTSRVQQATATLRDMFAPRTWRDLRALAPGFDWDLYLRERHAPAAPSVIVQEPAYIGAMARLVAQRPIDDWRSYLRWRVVSDAAPFLSSSIANETFRFARLRTGADAPPRWRRCTGETSADLPELLGRSYAERTMSPASKARIAAMARAIRAVLIERLRTVPWLTGASRAEALRKAESFGVRIGYPDRWHDDSALHLAPGAFPQMRNSARQFESDRLMARIGRAPVKGEWDFHGYYYFLPQSPTAWANWNEIIFPAAYLQAPLFNATADLPENYGGIGVVIAHEMTHLFTADGGEIDAEGRIRHWWSPEDSSRFAAIQRRIVEQYDAYTVLDGSVHVNGTLTLDENLADIGGVELAYAALAKTRRSSADARRFFVAYARARASKSRPEYLRRQVVNDGHAPSQARVNGPLADFAPFAAAFGCRTGDPMAPAARVTIW